MAHAWEYLTHFSDDFRRQAKRARGRSGPERPLRGLPPHRTAGDEDRRLRRQGKLSGVWVEDRYVARYVAAHPDTLIGFLSVDPTQDGWARSWRRARSGLRGIKLLPMYAGFSPDDGRLDPLWRYADRHRLPVLLHTGTTFVAQAPSNTRCRDTSTRWRPDSRR